MNKRERDVRASRPNRIPVSGNRDVLAAKNVPENKKARWVNDVGDRVMRFIQGGYEFVTDQGVTVGEKTVEASKGVGAVIHRLVGTKQDGSHLFAYLMVIDKDLYDADQAAKMEEVDRSEDDMYHKANSGEDGTYGSMRRE